MKKKLSKLGNSLALVIDKPTLAMLGITKSTQLVMRTDGTSIVVTPMHCKKRSAAAVRAAIEYAQDLADVRDSDLVVSRIKKGIERTHKWSDVKREFGI